MIGGCPIKGDHIIVIPKSCDKEYQKFQVELCKRSREKKIDDIKKYAAGGNFFEWIITQKDRPDPVGHIADDIYRDSSFPEKSLHFEEIRAYIEDEYHFNNVMKSFESAWFEYIKQYPDRVDKNNVWCSSCGKMFHIDDATLVYEEDYGEISVVETGCFNDHTLYYDDYKSFPLKWISSPDKLESFSEKNDLSRYEVEKFKKKLKLWGVIPLNIKGYVYFLRSENEGEIKIGYAVDVEKRVKQLQTGHPQKLKVMATLKGDMELEKDIHDKFYKHRLNGEWFEPHPDLLAFISTIKN